MKNLITNLTILFIAAGFILARPALADSGNCQNIYGVNCPTGNLFLNKQIRNPQTGEFVDSLSSNGPTFLPGQEVDFRIIVQNTGSSELDNINVQDQFPSFLDFTSGIGNFNQSSRVLSWSIGSLGAGASQTFDIRTHLENSNVFPSSGITCLTNSSQATTSNQVANDTAVFCVQTQILGTAQVLPETGPSGTEILLFGILTSFSLATTLFIKKQMGGGEFIER